jgi:hypothetical protein
VESAKGSVKYYLRRANALVIPSTLPTTQSKTSTSNASEDEVDTELTEAEQLLYDQIGHNIQTIDKNFIFITSIPSALEKFLSKSRCEINIDNNKNDDISKVKFCSRNLRDVLGAISQVNASLNGKRFFLPPTHYLAFKLYSDDILEKYQRFESEVLRFMPSGDYVADSRKLHLTIGVVHLLNQSEIDEAGKIMRECLDEIKSILGGKSLNIKLCGVDIMDDDPENTDIVYAKVEPNPILTDISNLLLDRFVSNGFAKRQNEEINFHCTVLSSTYDLWRKRKALQKEKGREEMGKRRKRMGGDGLQRQSFSSVGLLRHFNNFDFGCASPDRVTLCFKPGLKGQFQQKRTSTAAHGDNVIDFVSWK